VIGRKANGELRRAELEEARLGFIQFLRRKRFSPQFIASHGDDLFATAALEYSRKIAQGVEIESPSGWLITCAWRRTKSLLEAESRSPRVVSTEKAEVILDEAARSPEELALDEDRFRRIHAAVDQLSADEQRLLALAYFEDMAVREAARQLDWHPSKAQRCHESARRRLHELLGVDSLDELELDVGLAAYLSIVGAGSSALRVPAGIEAVAERVSRGAASGWTRAQELGRRVVLGGGGEPSATAALGGGAGRAAGVCATAALACFASGVVGPGVGGVNLLGGGAEPGPTPRAHRVATTTRPVPAAPIARSAPSAASQHSERTNAGTAEQQNRTRSAPSASVQREKRAAQAVSSQSLESAAESPEEVSSAPVETAPVADTSSPSPPSSTASASSAPTAVANEQFGP
jgi:RNA polymerase sigma factor (sigma-70 family)